MAPPTSSGGVVSGRSNYRKTTRRQGPPRSAIERLHAANKKHSKNWSSPVILFFRPPKEIEKLIHLGEHSSLYFDVRVHSDGIQLFAWSLAEAMEAMLVFLTPYTGKNWKQDVVASAIIQGAEKTPIVVTYKGEASGKASGPISEDDGRKVFVGQG